MPEPVRREDLSGQAAGSYAGRPALYGPDDRLIGSDQAFEGRTPSPSRPLSPALEPGFAPRRWFPGQGWNLTYTPRAEGGQALTPFQTLRVLADSCDVVRACIEDLKGSICGLGWDIHPDDDDVRPDERKDDIAAVRKFLRSPDGEHDFNGWLTMVMEEMFVTDAVSIYRHRAVDGTPLYLNLVDGATVKPLIDVYGKRPKMPAAAYQQIILGRVETQFTAPAGDSLPFASECYACGAESDGTTGPACDACGDDRGLQKIELCYLPQRPRSHSAYGHSRVEMVLITINLMLRRQMHYLSYFTAGSVPDAIYKMPEKWSTQQIAEFDEMWTSRMAGQDDQRRGLRFVPGDKDSGILVTKVNDERSYEFDEWLGRVCAWIFGISPLPIAKMVNRASSQQMDVAETDAALRPLKKWVAESVIEPQIREFLGYEGLRFIFTEDKAEDEKVKVDRNIAYVKEGILSRSEVRDDLGLDEAPQDGSVLLVDTATGPVKVPSAEDLAAGPVVPGTGQVPPSGSGQPHPALAAAPPIPGIGPAKPSSPGPVPPGKPHPALADAPTLKAAGADLRRWKKCALKDVETGRRREFKTETVAPALKLALAEFLRQARCREDVEWAFTVLAKSRRPLIQARRRIRHQDAVRKLVAQHFHARAPHVAAAIARHYADRLTQVEKKVDPVDEAIDREMKWDLFASLVQAPLAETYLDGEVIAADAGGVESGFGLTSAAAVDYAKKRAAELVGKRIDADGNLVDNPNAKWSVPQTTRDRLRAEIENALESGLTETQLRKRLESEEIWNWRADMIARTEVAYALNAGTVDSYKGVGVEKVEIIDGPGCLEDGHDDSEPGVDGETWPLEKFEEFPLGHPNCRRSAMPVMPEEEGE